MAAEVGYATVTYYDQEAWLIKIGLLPGSLNYVDVFRQPMVKDIQNAVADHFHIDRVEMKGRRRARLRVPRTVATCWPSRRRKSR